MMTTLSTLILGGTLAITTSDVKTQTVEFKSHGDRIVGTLYIPAKGQTPRPAIIVTGAWMTVKEQMPARYARELADRGFVTLVFDFRGWGQSGGSRRQFESPNLKIEDLLAATTFLKGRPEVQKGAIGGLALCASAGYLVSAATKSSDLKSLAVVAPWMQDPTIVEAVYGGKDGVRALIDVGRKANEAYAKSGRPEMRVAASTTDKSALMFGVPYYTETKRGQIPEWRNEVDLGFWEGWLTFNPMAVASKVKQPFFLVHSEAAAIPMGARQFYALVPGPKSELWLDKVTQFDFYDQNEVVRKASDAVAKHFESTLGR
ncbi:MAG TPA: alpha/beta hydrolase [Fimbriimonadaceae bacterium]|nr:alpha/beta hydrolase [Fimbriimonadaceae bacterium]